MAKSTSKQQKATKPENWENEQVETKHNAPKGTKSGSKTEKGCKNCK
ncbi:MAG: hypothetical protein IK048_05805 [Clostridia bacterium]|nr:hypothetical protein [Clostridia bacterium]